MVHDGSEIRAQKVASVLAVWLGLAPAKVEKTNKNMSSSNEPSFKR